MPSYNYKCRLCGRTFERMQKITDEPLTECEESLCGGTIHRVPQAVGISFKGSGFYTNDYRTTKPSYKDYVT